ncbi:MAG: NUDIX domain-containing protein [Egibacteraceae bacterium]
MRSSAALTALLPILVDGELRVATPSSAVAKLLATPARAVRQAEVADLADGQTDALVLGDAELATAGDHAEARIAEVAGALRLWGKLVVVVPGLGGAQAHGAAETSRTFDAQELARVLGHRGFAIEGQWAPGAAAALRGAPSALHTELDRSPGLLDAAPELVVAGRNPRDPEGRSTEFFATLPLKVVAAAVVCRDPLGRLLVVHDSFKGWWTIPGGVVDADEAPRDGARREAWEEAGVRVEIGDLLAVFAYSWPDRVLLLYAATPRGDDPPAPVHTHEISEAAWLPLDEALTRLNPRTAGEVRHSLARLPPG